MIVAINKIDKPDAKPERVRTELLQHEVQVETLGGDVLDVEVSATKKTQSRQAARNHRPAGRNPRPQGQSEPSGRRHRDRGQARSRPRPGRDRAGPARHPARRRHRRRRRRMGPRARARSATPATPVDAPVLRCRSRCSASTARRMPATGSRSSTANARAREVTDYRARQKRDKHGGARHRHARLARADDGAGQDRGPQGIPAGHQGRRAGLDRGDHRRARQARHRRGRRARDSCRASAASPNPTSRWRKPPAPRSSASTCAPTRKRARRPNRPASRSAITTSSTISWTT